MNTTDAARKQAASSPATWSPLPPRAGASAAIQIAKLLGAGRVVGAGREVSRLASSGADEVVSLAGEREAVMESLGKAAGEADIVLD